MVYEVAEKIRNRYKNIFGGDVEIIRQLQKNDESSLELHISSKKIRDMGWVPENNVEDVITDIFSYLQNKE
jgi:nucleoside-diphosphate-sugar epimerase